jgi:hypothetical protein
MRCSKCGREAFLVSTAQKWRRDNWVFTEKFLCPACGAMYISEDGETWQIPIEEYGPAEISAKP